MSRSSSTSPADARWPNRPFATRVPRRSGTRSRTQKTLPAVSNMRNASRRLHYRLPRCSTAYNRRFVHVLGIDQGTTGTRAAVIDEEGAVKTHAHRAHRQHYPQPGWVEHDPLEIWANTEQVIEAVVDRKIDAIAIANQGETVLAWDRETLTPIDRAYVWQDLRAQGLIESLALDHVLAKHVTVTTGLRLDAYFSAAKIRWLFDHSSLARQLAAKDRLAIGTI